MNKKLIIKIVIVVAVIITIVVLWIVQSQPKSELPIVRYVNFKVYDPVYVGIDQGFYEKHGITVEVVGDTLAGPTAIQAVSAGAADAGLSSIPAIINANTAGLPIIGVTDIQSALPGQPLEYYYSRCEDKIKSIKDMKGKNAAVNLLYSSFHYTIIMELENNGMVEDDLTYTLIPFQNQPAALLGGDVDMIGLMEPYNSQALGLYPDELCPVFNAIDTFGTKQFTLHFLNRIWAENNPELARAFVLGTVDAINWIEDNQEASKAIQSKYTDVPIEFVPDYYFQENGAVIMEDVQFWFDYLKNKDENQSKYWMDIEYIATNKFGE